MTMLWRFGDRINRWTNGIVDPCSADEAAKRHEDGRTYAAVLYEDDGRIVVGLELVPGKPFAGVHFYDDLQRPNLTYVFQAAKERLGLFLSQTGFSEYAGDQDTEPVRNEICRVREADRMIYLDTGDKSLNLRESKEGVVEESELWLRYEPVPPFGEFASLLRIERDRPLEQQPAHSPSWAASATPIR